MVDKENETIEEIFNEFEITQEEEKPIAEEVKPKKDLKEKHVEKVQQKAAKLKKSLKKIYLGKRVNMMMVKKMGYGNIGIKKVLKIKK